MWTRVSAAGVRDGGVAPFLNEEWNPWEDEQVEYNSALNKRREAFKQHLGRIDNNKPKRHKVQIWGKAAIGKLRWQEVLWIGRGTIILWIQEFEDYLICLLLFWIVVGWFQTIYIFFFPLCFVSSIVIYSLGIVQWINQSSFSTHWSWSERNAGKS